MKFFNTAMKWGIFCGGLFTSVTSEAAPLTHSEINGSRAEICAQHFPHGDVDGIKEFANGPIIVPSGTVLEKAGHAFAGASDPRDYQHLSSKLGALFPTLSKAENDRRLALLSQDGDRSSRREAIITTSDVQLTEKHNCATVPVKAIVSAQWEWENAHISGEKDIYYQAYGVVREDKIDTSFDAEAPAFSWAAKAGEINAIVTGEVTDSYNLPPD